MNKNKLTVSKPVFPTNWGKWAIHALWGGEWHQFYSAENLVCAKADLISVMATPGSGSNKIEAGRICYGDEHPEVKSGKRREGEVREIRYAKA